MSSITAESASVRVGFIKGDALPSIPGLPQQRHHYPESPGLGLLVYFRRMVASVDWLAVKNRIAVILYSPAPLAERYTAICKELEPLDRRNFTLSGVRIELDSMARSASEGREAPFLLVGKDLLTYCYSRLYREIESRGEDPRWITRLQEHEEEQADEERECETGSDVF
jgi:hypothetical protein